MTISKKLNKSITTALITLLMLSTFIGLISFAGATTSSPSTTVLSGTGTGSALWSDAQKLAGDFSVKLSTTAASDTAEVKIPTNFLLDDNDLSQLNFTGFAVAPGTGLNTQLNLKVYMDRTGDGTADYYYNVTTVTPAAEDNTNAWANYVAGSTWAIKAIGNANNVLGQPNNTPNTYATWVANETFAAHTVVGVSVIISGTSKTIYVDHMAIGNTIYNLEPVALTLNQASANVQQTTPTAPCGDAVHVFAANGTFTNSELVKIFFQGIAPELTSFQATPNGGLIAWITTPEKLAGDYTVTALGTVSGKTSTGTLKIATPTVTLTPALAVPGSTVTITGTNFALNGHVNMTFNGEAWGATNITVASNGTIVSGTTALVPNLAPGTYTVSVTDNINTKTATFVIPTVQIRPHPATGPVGLNVTLQGAGFSRNGLVQIYFGGSLIWSTTADSIGNLTSNGGQKTTFLVPPKATGAYSIIAIDVTTGTSSNGADFTIPAPTLAISKTIGPVGSTLSFNATGFKVSSQVNLTLAGVTTSFTSGADGKLTSQSLTVPDKAAGANTIVATDGTNSVSKDFTIAVPTIVLSPSAGPVGTIFWVNGTNFKLGSTVTINFTSTTALTSATASSDTGNFTIQQTVPGPSSSFPIGVYTINATDGINAATATFDIGAAIMSATPGQGPPGTLVNIQGKGFTAGNSTNVYFDETLIASLNANNTGGINFNMTVPDVVKGTHAITAYDSYTGLTTPEYDFVVSTPTLTTAPTQEQVGTVVMVAGTLYKLNATVSIYFNGELVATVAANSAGGLPANANFTVPSVVPGAYIVNATDGVNFATAQFNVFGTGGIDEVLTIVTEIKATLAEYGSFYNFTNTWFTTIDNKLGNFTGEDTVASLLYSIQSKVNLPSELMFDFGGPSADDMTAIHVSNATEYSIDTGFGWIDITDLQFRERATAARKDFKALICSQEAAVFQVALPNGEYIVSVFQGDADWAHDDMTIIANGEFINTVNSAKGQVVPTDFKVTVEDGLLQITFDDAGGADGNWVLNGLVIRQNWAPAQ